MMTIWPTWMDHLKAKSPDMGGQTLAQHTWDVLARMADQRVLRPHLTESLGERLWSQAFWAAFLHDFGKAAAGFQGVLRGEKGRWSEVRHRHEVLSLGFIDWLFPKSHPDRLTIIAIIACHHKDASALLEKYGGVVPMSKLDDAEKESYRHQLIELAGNIDGFTRQHLWRWIDECAADWAESLGFTLIDPPALTPWDTAEAADLGKAIFSALRDLHGLTMRTDSADLRTALLLRGLIFTADHSASAGVDGFPAFPLTRAHAEAPLRRHARPALPHQQAASAAPRGSAVLVAPTGSGKTEAALLWAAQQVEQRPTARLFYTLPYQASMNAMYLRLATDVLGYTLEAVHSGQADTISISHSRALLKRYQDMMSLDEHDPRQAARQAKWLKNKSDLNIYPIQVFSPYQMLKVAYSLKGFEALLLDYADALFIFDEIHAYEPKRLALIIELMRWLRERYGARFFVMTATLPPMLRERLADALCPTVIEATEAEFERSRRHVVRILDGRLEDAIVERVRADREAGRSVLVCLNRVADAQRVYRLLQDAFALTVDDDIVLLHGRFNGRDRSRKEDILLRSAGVASADRRPFVCVATQVVEVSLNVDFDTLYTDPAPLEALLQRFGRVNRGRRAGAPLLPVHVFSLPTAVESRDPYLPYQRELVERSLAVLRDFCADSSIDESQVTSMLDAIYTGEILADWETEYAASARTFTRDILGAIRPFESGESIRFYELFDGIEVLPTELLDVYYAAREQQGYLEASQYLVSIPYSTYGEFNGYGLIRPARKLEGEYADHISVDYDPEYGLDLDGARRDQKQAAQLRHCDGD